MIIDINELIENLEVDALEEGYPVPKLDVITEARRIAVILDHEYPDLEFDIYVMREGSVAVESHFEFGKGMLLVCEPGKSAFFTVTNNQKSESQRYENSENLPDDFIRQNIDKMIA